MLRWLTAGESHGPELVAILEGLPAGVPITTSNVQESLARRRLGYGRGARLIDFMAEDGVVGQYAGSQAREVLLTMDQWAQRNGLSDLVPDSAPRRLKIQPHASANAAVAITARHRDAPELAQDNEFEDSQHASAHSPEHCSDVSFANSHDDQR